jgi:hypothetical protein
MRGRRSGSDRISAAVESCISMPGRNDGVQDIEKLAAKKLFQ